MEDTLLSLDTGGGEGLCHAPNDVTYLDCPPTPRAQGITLSLEWIGMGWGEGRGSGKMGWGGN